MKKFKRRMPVNVPLNLDGSILDVFQDFINKMRQVTDDNVELDCDLDGNITIYFESSPHKPIINKRPQVDLDVLYRGEYINPLYSNKINKSNDLTMKNNVSSDERKLKSV